MKTGRKTEQGQDENGTHGKATSLAALTEWESVVSRHSIMLALEPRFMFDAAVAATADAADPGTAQPTGPETTADVSAGEDAGDGDGNDVTAGDGRFDKPDDFGDIRATGFGTFGIGTMAAGPDITLPGDVTLDENSTKAIGGIVIGEPDGANEIRVTISVENGTLAFTHNASDKSVIFNPPLGGGNSSYTLTGDPTSVNTVLATLKYTGHSYYSGTDVLTITVEGDGFDPVTGTVDITIADINTPAEIDLGLDNGESHPGLEMKEGETSSIPGLSIVDHDRGANGKGDVITVVLETNFGELLYDSQYGGLLDGASSDVRPGDHVYKYVFTGERDDINALLAGLQYKPEAHQYGTDTLKITAWDDLWVSEMESGPKAAESIEIRVTPVPDAPEMPEYNPENPGGYLHADATENDPNGVTLDYGMFQITDVDTPDALLTIKVVGLPTSGYLTKDGVRIPDNATFSVADVKAGKIKYVHESDNSKVRDDVQGDGFYATDSFYFTVTDGTGNYVTGGDWDVEAGTGAAKIGFTIDLVPVNDEAVVKPGGDGVRTVVVDEDGNQRFAVYEGEDGYAVKFTIEDTDQAPGVDPDIYITELPVDGVLKWDGVEITASDLTAIPGSGGKFGFKITKQGIDDGKLTYDHSGVDGLDFSPPGPSGSTRDDGFSILVVDDGGGTGTPGFVEADLDLHVLPNNDNPEFVTPPGPGNLVGGDTVNNWGLKPFNPGDGLNVTDKDSPSGAITYRLVENPPAGFELYKEVAPGQYRRMYAGDSFTQSEINSGTIQFRYVGNAGMKTPCSTHPQQQDPNTGLWHDCFHHQGEGDLKLQITDGSLNAWARDDLGVAHEGENIEGGIGEWVNGQWVLTTFTYKLGVDLHACLPGEPINPVEVGDFGVRAESGDPVEAWEGGETVLGLDHLKGYTTYKENGVPKEDLNNDVTFRLMELPENGALYKNGVIMSKYESFTQQDLLDGNIVYKHGGDEAFTDSFSVTASDGVRNFGATEANPEGTKIVLGINVRPTNDTPEAGGSLTVNEGVEPGQVREPDDGFDEMGVVIGFGDIVHDVDGSGGPMASGYESDFGRINNGMEVVLTEAPQYGDLWVYNGSGDITDIANWTKVTVNTKADVDSAGADWSALTGTVLTKAQFDAGHVRYIHNGLDPVHESSAVAGYNDSFKIMVNDGMAIGNGGQIIPGANTSHGQSVSEEGVVEVTIIERNDLPRQVTGKNPYHTPEKGGSDPDATYDKTNGGTIIGNEHLEYRDSDHRSSELQYVITKPPVNGTLYKKDSSGGEWYALSTSSFTQADIDAGFIKYVHRGTETHSDSFEYVVRDTAGGGIAGRFDIIVDPTNNAPVIATSTGNLEGGVFLDDPGGKDLFKDGKGVFQISDRDYTDPTGNPIAGTARDTISVVINSIVKTGANTGNNWGIFDFAPGFDTTGLTITGDGAAGGLITIEGTLDAVNAALAKLTFKPEGTLPSEMDINAAVSITISVDDNANGDVGGNMTHARTDTSEITLYVSPYNDQPGLSGTTPPSSGVYPGYVFEVVMDEDTVREPLRDGSNNPIQISDQDAFHRNVNTISLKVENGRLNFDPAALSGLTFVTGGNNSSEVVLRGTIQQLNAALASMKYTPAADWNGVDVLQVEYVDGNAGWSNNENPGASGQWGTGSDGQKGFQAEVKITVNPVNDAPTVEVSGPKAVSGTGYQDINADGAIRVDDPKDLNVPGGTDDSWPNPAGDPWMRDYLEVTVNVNDAATGKHGSLKVDATGVTVDNNESATVTIKGTRDAVNAALETLQYANTDNAGNNTQVILTVTVRDAGNGHPGGNGPLDASATILLLVSDANDAPQLTVGQSALSVAEDAAATSVPGLSVADQDALDFPIKVTLSVEHGVLSVTGSLLESGGAITGQNTKTITITASQDNINAILATLKYKPAANFNGQDILNILVDDQGNFSVADPASDEGKAQTDSGTVTITVTPVNDAPVLINKDTPVAMDPVPEDIASAANTGQTVRDLFGDRFSDPSDTGQAFPADLFAGVVVVKNNSVGSAKGTWEYSLDGVIWQAIGTQSGTSGLYLDANASIRFAPAAHFNGTAPTLEVKMVENLSYNSQSDPSSTGTMPASGASGVNSTYHYTGIFSKDSVALTLTVTAVNDAPQVIGGGGQTVTLPAISEDIGSGSNGGKSIQDLFGGKFSDPFDNITGHYPGDSFAGVMIHENTADAATQGAWQYSLDGGTTWMDVGNVSQGSALYLGANAVIRFQPAADYNGTPPGLSACLAETINADSPGGTTLPPSGSRNHDITGGNRGGTTSFSADSVAVAVTVTAVNDAPVAVDKNVPVAMNPVNEDDHSSTGSRVSDLFGSRFSDPLDAKGDGGTDALAGVVVVGNAANPATEGAWEYSLDGGVIWTAIGACSDSAGRFLAADSTTMIRFNPVENYHGTPPSLTVRLVETANGDESGAPSHTNGATVDVSANGGTTIHSADTLQLGITVTPVNDAPVVTSPGTGESLPPIFVDQGTGTSSSTVGDLFGDRYADPDDTGWANGGDSFTGVVVIGNGVNPAEGRWEYSVDGVSWSDVGIRSDTDGLYLDANTTIRFVAVSGYSGTPGGLEVVLVEGDANSDAAGPVLSTGQDGVDASTRGGTTIYSSGSIDLGVYVYPRNLAPTDAGSGNAALPDIPEDTDASANNGSTVDGIFSSRFQDAVASNSTAPIDSFAGVVVIGNTADPETEGAWQYSTDGGLTWNDIGQCAESNGLYLEANAGARIRFQPVADYNGLPPTLAVRLAETVNFDSLPDTVLPANGARGVDVGAGKCGEHTSYSEDIIHASITVTPVDDVPVARDDAHVIDLDRMRGGEADGNILDNDSHPDTRNGVTIAVDNPTGLQGQYGAFTVQPDGSFVYVVNAANPDIAGMKTGDTLVDVITYTLVDSRGVTTTATLTVEINYDHANAPIVEESSGGGVTPEAPPREGTVLPPLSQPPVVENVHNAANSMENAIRDSHDSFKEGLNVPRDLPSAISGLTLPDLEEWTLEGGVDQRQVSVGERQDLGLPESLFKHSKPNMKLNYTAAMSDGSQLLDWIVFDPETFCLTCTPPEGTEGAFDVLIKGEDTRGNSADAIVTLRIGEKAEDARIAEGVGEGGGPGDGEAGTETVVEPAEEVDEKTDQGEVMPIDLVEFRRLLLDDTGNSGTEQAVLEDSSSLDSQIAETGSSGLQFGARRLATAVVE